MPTSALQLREANRFDVLEGWRGIAALMVLFYHSGVNLRHPPLALFGFCGVHLFFVLSGYLLFRPYATAILQNRTAPATGNFYSRRLLRIVPPYMVSLALFALLRLKTGTNVPTGHNLLLHALLIFNYFPTIDFFSINPVLWSLAIEAQFYILLPIVCLQAMRALRGRRPAVVVGVCVGAMALLGLVGRFVEVGYLSHWYASLANADHIRYRSTFAYLDSFAFGMLAAALQLGGTTAVRSLWNSRLKRAMIVVAAIILIFAANDWCAIATGGTWQSGGPLAFEMLFPIVLCAGLSLLLLYLVTNPRGGPRWMRVRPLRWIGEVSYSLYLYHTGVLFFTFRLNLFHRLPYNLMTLATALLALGPALAVAAIMYFLVERPSLKLVARIRDRQTAKAPTTEAAASDQTTPALQPISLLAP